ncbi:unnamed protein product [Pedinophyceae sp. YPF-701]|nr:unnamed protein product [Pedinophyceae sp. YPF-701]
MAEIQDAVQVAANLAEYEEQLEQTKQALQADPGDEELLGVKESLEEIITATKELLETLGGPDAIPVPAPKQPAAQEAPAGEQGDEISEPLPEGMTYVKERPPLPTTLPDQTLRELKKKQVKEALAGAGDPAWAIGHRCNAHYCGDGEEYPAVIVGATADRRFVVVYDGFGEYREVVRAAGIKPREEGQGYTGVAAPKVRRVGGEDLAALPKEIPKHLQISEGDDEKTRERKVKAIKTIKKKRRFAELDAKLDEQQSAWQKFKQGKTGKKFFKNKKSIFSVPEGGKVGVSKKIAKRP